MNKNDLSSADVEQLLAELARQDAQTQLMRGAASGEIRRVFRRRKLLRVAAESSVVGLLAGAACLLLPDDMRSLSRETAAAAPQAAPAAVAAVTPVIAGKTSDIDATMPCADHGCTAEPCEVVIYSVPL